MAASSLTGVCSVGAETMCEYWSGLRAARSRPRAAALLV